MQRTLRCFAHGHDGEWQAICIDFDLAVSGRSFEEVKALLDRSIRTYVEDALNEEPAVREALLNRAAPWHVRMSYIIRFMLALRFRRNDPEAQFGFSVPCRA